MRLMWMVVLKGLVCVIWMSLSLVVPQIDPSVPQPVFTITEKAPARAFSWLKVPTCVFTFTKLLRHYAKQALTHGK